MGYNVVPNSSIYLTLSPFPSLVQAFPVLDRNKFVHGIRNNEYPENIISVSKKRTLYYHTFGLLLFLLLGYWVIQKTTF